MILEGSQEVIDVSEALIGIKLSNTNVRELSRLYAILQTIFDQGVMNTRNGKVVLHFNDKGELNGVDKEVSTWRKGKQVITRVAIFDKALVEILNTVV